MGDEYQYLEQELHDISAKNNSLESQYWGAEYDITV